MKVSCKSFEQKNKEKKLKVVERKRVKVSCLLVAATHFVVLSNITILFDHINLQLMKLTSVTLKSNMIFFLWKFSFYSSKIFSHLRWHYFKLSYEINHFNSRNMYYYSRVQNRPSKCRIKMSKTSKKSISTTGFWVLFYLYL